MSKSPSPTTTVHEQREALRRRGSLHWLHWLVVGASLVVTVGAWQFSKRQVDDELRDRFERETSQIVHLVDERMAKYEDALWSGVAHLNARQGNVDEGDWAQYAGSLRLGEKYPGIRGIGVVEAVDPKRRASFVVAQKVLRPDFELRPRHSGELLLPIVAIEPLAGNERAIGFDLASEPNRFKAAQQARDSARSQITGPITLVQDTEKTPGPKQSRQLRECPGCRGFSVVRRAWESGRRVGTPSYPGAPLTEPDLWTSHPALRDVGVLNRRIDGLVL